MLRVSFPSPFSHSHFRRCSRRRLIRKTLIPPSPKILTLTVSSLKKPYCPQIPFPSSPLLLQIKPFVESQWQPILKGWILSAASVYCLSLSVPRVGRLPSLLAVPGSDNIVREGLILVTLALARSTMTYVQQALLWEAALGSACEIRAYVFDRVLERDLEFSEGKDGVPAGDVAHRIAAEAEDVADTLYAILNTTVPNSLQLLAMATRMVVISPVLSLMSALVIPCASLIVAYLGESLRKISRRAQLSAARLSAYLNEVLPSMLIVKANNGELNESLRFRRLAHDDLVQRLKKRKMKALIPQIVQVSYMGGLVVLCAGSLMVSRNSFDTTSLLSFIMSLALLIEPLKVYDKPDAVDMGYVRGDIKFNGVSFKYGDNMPLVLNGLNLHIKSGERVALIGPSGGGKTTLTKLLLRLYDPLCGCILVDDRDIKDIRLRSLREHIILVPQDMNLFSGTVAENIGYRDSVDKINMECVEKAARVANADEFIRSLSKGYQTNIGQRGSLLSGGQKQRLSIARALYHKSSILILDEATSALDGKCEQLVRQALEHLMSKHTVIIIAHRLETVLMADRVFLLEGGQLKEVPKSSLLTQDGPSALGKLII